MRTIRLGNEEIALDEETLKLSEHTLNQFLQNYASKYNYYVERHSDAQYVNSRHEDRHKALWAEKFKTYKDMGATDKMAEARATSDPEVQDALENVRLSKHTANLLWGFIRSMDRAHENAIQLGFNLRKELDRLWGSSIKSNE